MTHQPEHGTYRVTALRYATLPSRTRAENFVFRGPNEDTLMPMDYFVWLVQGHERTILVDTGCTREVAEARGRTYLHDVPQLLARLDVAPTDIDDIVITHLHYDHAGGLDWFPDVPVHLQRRELAFTDDVAMRFPVISQPFEDADISRAHALADAGRLLLHDGSAHIAPGIELHLLGGHTGGLQVVRVWTARGWLVLASDALHYSENRTSGNPFPLVANVVEMLEGHRMCETLASGEDLIVPGHDPEVRRVHAVVDGNADLIRLA